MAPTPTPSTAGWTLDLVDDADRYLPTVEARLAAVPRGPARTKAMALHRLTIETVARTAHSLDVAA